MKSTEFCYWLQGYFELQRASSQPGMALTHEQLDEDLSHEYYKLHREIDTALEIVLRTGQFELGEYSTTAPYKRDWKLVKKFGTLDQLVHKN